MTKKTRQYRRVNSRINEFMNEKRRLMKIAFNKKKEILYGEGNEKK